MSSARAFRFAGFTLDFEEGVLREGERAVDLRPKAFELLSLLVENAGRVMPKDELLDRIWPTVTVTEDSLTQCVGELRRALGAGASAIKTVPRRGYMFEKSALVQGGGTSGETEHVTSQRPSIAVMPFRNLSGDPAQDYFADGIVEDITTALGHFRHIVVISRNSAFSFKGAAAAAADVGQALGVRYLLQGSVRKAGDRLRLTTQLIEAESGVQLWAEQLDGVLTDVFAFQDEVTRRTIGAIAPRLMHAELERLRRKRPESLDAYELYLKAQAQLRMMTREANDEALRLVEQALGLEPDYAAVAGLGAWACSMRDALDWSSESSGNAQKGLELAARAIRNGQDDAEALSLAGYALGFFGSNLDDGIATIERAIALNPNSALAFTNAGWLRAYKGDAARAIEDFDRALALSPRDPGLYRLNSGLAVALVELGDFAGAITAARRAIADNPNYLIGHRVLTAALAHSGKLEEALEVADVLRRNGIRVSSHAPRRMARFARGLEPVLRGLRMAGLEE
jgi:TolB-like protein/Flp pilus assembly protein TadD